MKLRKQLAKQATFTATDAITTPADGGDTLVLTSETHLSYSIPTILILGVRNLYVNHFFSRCLLSPPLQVLSNQIWKNH